MKGIFLEKVRREKNKSNKIWNKTNGPINIIGPFSYKNKKEESPEEGGRVAYRACFMKKLSYKQTAKCKFYNYFNYFVQVMYIIDVNCNVSVDRL